MKHPHEHATPANMSMLELRQRLLGQIWSFFALVAGVGIPLSFIRIWRAGWMDVYVLHLGFMAVFLLGHLWRARMSHEMRLGLLVLATMTTGVAGLWTFGLLGAGVWLLVLGALVAGITHSGRLGLILFAFVSVVYVLIALSFIVGWHDLDVDVITYIVRPAPWITSFVFAILLPALIAMAVGGYQHAISEQLHEIERQRDELRQLAFFDELTGLPSRRLALDRLAVAARRAVRHDNHAVVLFLDLDAFKAVNDTYGHAMGDEVLCSVARRLQRVLRLEDTVARFGGDEFLVILGDVDDLSYVETLTSRIQEVVCAPITLGQDVAHVGVSIGAAVVKDPDETAAAIIDLADRAMYEAKNAADDGVVFAHELG